MARMFRLVVEEEPPTKIIQSAPTRALMETTKEEGISKGVVDLLPKNLQKKSGLILSVLGDHLKLNDQNQIIYADNSIGSNIHDLLRYFTSSVHMSPGRPFDANQFSNLIEKTGVPDSALGYGRSTHQKVEPKAVSPNQKVPAVSIKQKAPKVTWRKLF